MTNKEAIKIWQYVKDHPTYDSDIVPIIQEACDMAIKALEQTQWTPVSEKPPEESFDSIIGWDAYRQRCVFVQYIDGYFQITGTNESFDIRAWMPLPEPYKAESEE